MTTWHVPPKSEVEKLRALLAEARGWVAPGSHVRAQIDAALAEPVADWQQAHGEALAAWSKVSDERDEARAEAAKAYRRGAEAMREAAATAVLTRFHLSSVTLAQSIRNLPIPEDWNKPDGVESE
jgi:hypothetical protein